MKRVFRAGFLVLVFCGVLNSSLEGVVFKEEVLLDEAGSFTRARHLVIRGTNQEIGATLARLAHQRYDLPMEVSSCPHLSKARRSYIEKNAPVMHARIEGARKQLLLDGVPELQLPEALYVAKPKMACSGFYCPPNRSETGHAYVSRNLDIGKDTRGAILRKKTDEDLGLVAEPYVMEIYPDEGYSTLTVGTVDLLAPAIDGINSEGICISSYVDRKEGINDLDIGGSQCVGLTHLQACMHVLTHCATLEEAKEALLELKIQYPLFTLHFLLADAKGNSFIFERDPHTNEIHITDSQDQVQVITNHLIYAFPEASQHLDETNPYCSFQRFCRLEQALTGGEEALSEDQLLSASDAVFVPVGGRGLRPNSGVDMRTNWNSFYNLSERSLRVRFYKDDVRSQDGEGWEHGMSQSYTFTLDT